MQWTNLVEKGCQATNARYCAWKTWLVWMESLGGEDPRQWPTPAEIPLDLRQEIKSEQEGKGLLALQKWWSTQPAITYEDPPDRQPFFVTSFRDTMYPADLLLVEDPPPLLWSVRPLDVSWWTAKRVAVVGARANSVYGARMAQQFARHFAQEGAVVISGCAIGIDSYAHEAALRAGGRTVGWVAGGIDQITPRVRRLLASKRANILSEYPVGTPVAPWRYTQRNRLIAGLAQGVLVVEAGEASGTLHTVRHAGNQGKEVFVVPHSTVSVYAPSVTQLINDGAWAACDPEFVLNTLAKGEPLGIRETLLAQAKDAEEYQLIEHLLSFDGSALGSQVSSSLGWSKARWLAVVSRLQLRGVVEIESGVLTLSDMIQS